MSIVQPSATHLSALHDAAWLLHGAHDSLSLRDALKQAGIDHGIQFGPEMKRFVEWGTAQLLAQDDGCLEDHA